MSKQIIVITGASSGFGALTARALAREGHTVYAGIRATQGRNAKAVAEAAAFAKENGVDLRTVELDVASIAPPSKQASPSIIADAGHLDVVIHNAGHMSFGPAEAFTPEQFAELYRRQRALHPAGQPRSTSAYVRKQGKGLVVWVSSSSTRGGTPPYLSPYFAAKAAMDSLAVSYAAELTRWGIETVDHRAGRLHQGHQPLRPFWIAGGHGAGHRI
jgi:NAD(P)-dependent dehydrogenase (short-subunit alcohol dehydrogenase family)